MEETIHRLFFRLSNGSFSSEKLELVDLEVGLLEGWEDDLWVQDLLSPLSIGILDVLLIMMDWLLLVSEKSGEWIKLLVSLGLSWDSFVCWEMEGEHLSDFLKKISQIWELELQFFHPVHMSVFLKSLMEFGVELRSLDMCSLTGLIPLVVESIDGVQELSESIRECVDLIHLLLIRVAGILLHQNLEDLNALSHDIEHVVEESVLKSFLESADSWVLKAPVLHVITDSHELAFLLVLPDEINNIVTKILDLVDGDSPPVIFPLGLEVLPFLVGWVHPSSEALVRDDISVLIVVSLERSHIHSFGELSVSLEDVVLL